MNQHRSCENAGQAFDPLGIIMAIGMNWMNIELNKTSLKPSHHLWYLGAFEKSPGIWSWGGELPKESFQRLRQQARGRAEGLKGLKGLIGKWDKMSRNPVGSWSWSAFARVWVRSLGCGPPRHGGPSSSCALSPPLLGALKLQRVSFLCHQLEVIQFTLCFWERIARSQVWNVPW